MDFSESEDEETKFEKAIAIVRVGNFSASQEQQLQLYGCFKQATVGPAKTEDSPGWFDFTGKAKFAAWSSLGNMSKIDAMRKYNEVLSNISPGWDGLEYIKSKQAKKEKWICSSTLGNNDEDNTPLDQKTICDLVADNDSENVLKLLELHPELVNFRDSENRTPLHFASDRANIALIEALVKIGADKNAKDSEGDTPLHYACACDHANVIEYLILLGANPEITNNDGQLPLASCDEALKVAFQRTNLNL